MKTKTFKIYEGVEITFTEIECTYHGDSAEDTNISLSLYCHDEADKDHNGDFIIFDYSMPESDEEAKDFVKAAYINYDFFVDTDGSYHIGTRVGEDEQGNPVFNDGNTVVIY